MKLIILFIVLAICAIVALSVRLSPKKHRPLSQAQPQLMEDPNERQLGMEATDLSVVKKAEMENERGQRQNIKGQSHIWKNTVLQRFKD